MYEDTEGFQPSSKNTETTREVWGISGIDDEGREVLWPSIQNRERSDPGGPGFPAFFNIGVDAVVREVLLDVCAPRRHIMYWGRQWGSTTLSRIQTTAAYLSVTPSG